MIQLAKNKYVQLAVVLGLGIFVGNFFKNTKTIEEKVREETTRQYESILKMTKEEHSKETQSLNERITQVQQESKTQREEYTKNIESLRIENSELKQKVTKRKVKIVKHDGTIIEKEFEESETEQITSVITSVREEFKRKVESIEQKWSTLYRERLIELIKEHKSEIETLEEKHYDEVVRMQREYTAKINEKKFRPEVGMEYDADGHNNYYGHVSYPIWGSIVVGAGADTNRFFRFGLGFEL